VIGGVLQFVCAKYIENHPEILEDNISGKKELVSKIENPGLLSSRGGSIIDKLVEKRFITAFTKLTSKLRPHVNKMIITVGTKGLVISLIASAFGVKTHKNRKAIAKYLNGAMPYNYLRSEQQKCINLEEENKTTFGVCDQGLRFLLKVLTNSEISRKEKKKTCVRVFKQYVNLTTKNRRKSFIICIALLLQILAYSEYGSFVVLLRSLIDAIREGKISKAVGRAIIRRLMRQNIEIDPELIAVSA